MRRGVGSKQPPHPHLLLSPLYLRTPALVTSPDGGSAHRREEMIVSGSPTWAVLLLIASLALFAFCAVEVYLIHITL